MIHGGKLLNIRNTTIKTDNLLHRIFILLQVIKCKNSFIWLKKYFELAFNSYHHFIINLISEMHITQFKHP